MQSLYNIYLNIRKVWESSRKCVFDKEPLPLVEFAKIMKRERDRYILLQGRSGIAEFYIFFLSPFDETFKKTDSFKRTIKMIKPVSENNKIRISIITKRPFSKTINKLRASYKNMEIDNFLHMHFIVLDEEGLIIPKHYILDDEEIKELTTGLARVNVDNLPSISSMDPQCILNDAKSGQIIRIEFYSPLSGIRVNYRKVVSASYVDEITKIEEDIEETGDKEND
jgi:DNA-directed RNA polymerase subunit H (RpoH/RPB5)